MKKAIVGVLACALAVTFIACAWTGANSRRATFWDSFSIVHVEGPGELAAGNLSMGYMRWFTAPAEGNPGALLVRDGDLLYVKLKEKGTDKEAEFFVPWECEDGANLAFKVDGPRLLLADKTVSLDLDSKGEGWDWLANASTEDLAALRFVGVYGAIPDDQYGLFEKLARVNPHVGLNVNESALLARVPALDPRCLLVLVDKEGADLELVAKRRAIETLDLDLTNYSGQLDALAALPNLRRLTLEKFDSAKTAMPDLPRLESLTFADGTLQDLTPVKTLTGLKELNFTLGEVSSLKGIEALPQLQELGLCCGGKDKEPLDCAPLDGLKELRWATFGPAIAADQFARVVQTHPALQVAEVLNSEKIKSPAPLAKLHELRALIWLPKEKEGSTEPFKQMKQLRLLVLPAEMVKEKPGDVAELRGELPGCVIAEGEPFCLGAGRILLLVPLVALGWIVVGRRSRAA